MCGNTLKFGIIVWLFNDSGTHTQQQQRTFIFIEKFYRSEKKNGAQQ